MKQDQAFDALDVWQDASSRIAGDDFLEHIVKSSQVIHFGFSSGVIHLSTPSFLCLRIMYEGEHGKVDVVNTLEQGAVRMILDLTAAFSSLVTNQENVTRQW